MVRSSCTRPREARRRHHHQPDRADLPHARVRRRAARRRHGGERRRRSPGMIPVEHEAAYSASKAGLRAFTRSLAGDLAERGVRACSVCPGPVDTNFFGDVEAVPDLVFSQPMRSARPGRRRQSSTASATARAEIALPALSGKLCTLGYLFPSLEQRAAGRSSASAARRQARLHRAAPFVTRRAERWRGAVRAAARRLAVSARRLLLNDPGTSPDRRGRGRRGAEELARSARRSSAAASPRSRQLMAYLAGPGAATEIEARARAGGAVGPGARRRPRRRSGASSARTWARRPRSSSRAGTTLPSPPPRSGEVHAATLARPASPLAVKVQYPGVAEALRSRPRVAAPPPAARRLRARRRARRRGSIARLRDAVLRRARLRRRGRLDDPLSPRLRLRAGDADPETPSPSCRAAACSPRSGSTGKSLFAYAADATDEGRAAVALARSSASPGARRSRHACSTPTPTRGTTSSRTTAASPSSTSAAAPSSTRSSSRPIARSGARSSAPTARRCATTCTRRASSAAPARSTPARYREWELLLAAPYMAKGRFRWTRGYARKLAELTSLLVRAGGLTLPPGAVLLWRQRHRRGRRHWASSRPRPTSPPRSTRSCASRRD